MKTDKYQVCIYDPVQKRNSFLTHCDKMQWSKRTAQKHHDDIKRSWASGMQVSIIKVD